MSGKNIVSVSDDTLTKTNEAGIVQSISDLLFDKYSYKHELQPIYNLLSNEIRAVELFSRGPAKELTSPGVFFQMARELKELERVDMQCFENCIDYAEKLSSDFMVHINIFPETLEKVSVNRILSLTRSLREEKTICLELSGKTVHNNPERLIRKLEKLKEAGFLICLDDVGSGCCSIETLTLFEPHCIKLDRSIVADLVCDVHKVSAAARILKIVRALDCLTIAEGIETEDEFKAIRRLGILYGQGWYWCDDLDTGDGGLIKNYYAKNKLSTIANS